MHSDDESYTEGSGDECDAVHDQSFGSDYEDDGHSAMVVCKEDVKKGMSDGFEYDLANERVERVTGNAQQRPNRNRKSNDMKRASCHRCQTKPRAGIFLFECRHLRQKPTRGKPSNSSRSPLSSLPKKTACSFLFCTEERCLKGISTKLGVNFKSSDDMRKYFESGQPCPHCIGLELCENSNCTSRLKKLVNGGKYEPKVGPSGKSAGSSKSDSAQDKDKPKKEKDKRKSTKSKKAQDTEDDINPRPKKAKKMDKQHSVKDEQSSSSAVMFEDEAFTHEDFNAHKKKHKEHTSSSKEKSSKSRKSRSPIRKISVSSLHQSTLTATSSNHSSPPPLDSHSPPVSPSSLPSTPPATISNIVDFAPAQHFLSMSASTSSGFPAPGPLSITQRSSTLSMPHSPGRRFSALQSALNGGARLFFADPRRFPRNNIYDQLNMSNGAGQDFAKASMYPGEKSFTQGPAQFGAPHVLSNSAMFQAPPTHPMLQQQQMALAFQNPAYYQANRPGTAAVAAPTFDGHYSAPLYAPVGFPLHARLNMAGATQRSASGSTSPLLVPARKYEAQFPNVIQAQYINTQLQFPTNASQPVAPNTMRATN